MNAWPVDCADQYFVEKAWIPCWSSSLSGGQTCCRCLSKRWRRVLSQTCRWINWVFAHSKLIFLIAGTLRRSKRVAIEIQQQQHHCLPCESLIIKIYPQRINARHKDIHSKIKLGQGCKMSKTEKIVIVLKGVQPITRYNLQTCQINIFCKVSHFCFILSKLPQKLESKENDWHFATLNLRPFMSNGSMMYLWTHNGVFVFGTSLMSLIIWMPRPQALSGGLTIQNLFGFFAISAFNSSTSDGSMNVSSMNFQPPGPCFLRM